ncbi:MAG TPA: hypothetical protein VMV92_41480 [Streptosporangiaceae bacterium]|nr:hypothetical protein [Streptosporangiaceae bacterium]
MLAGLLAELRRSGAEPVADGLGNVLCLGFQGGGSLAELGGLGVGAGDVPAAGDAWSRLGVSRAPSRWQRALSRL